MTFVILGKKMLGFTMRKQEALLKQQLVGLIVFYSIALGDSISGTEMWLLLSWGAVSWRFRLKSTLRCQASVMRSDVLGEGLLSVCPLEMFVILDALSSSWRCRLDQQKKEIQVCPHCFSEKSFLQVHHFPRGLLVFPWRCSVLARRVC